MDRVSRPLLGVLVATVAFFALWLVALRPSSSQSGSGGLGQYQSAINSAHAAVGLSNRVGAAQSAASASTPTTATTATTAAKSSSAAGAPARSPSAAAAAAKSSSAAAAPAKSSSVAAAPARSPHAAARSVTATAAQREHAVLVALQAHKVLALLFYNPAAADDKAVAHELRSIPTRGARVFRLAVPISELSGYSALTNQVPVTTSPTLVLIDRRHTAATIVGYAGAFEIAQRVSDALAVR